MKKTLFLAFLSLSLIGGTWFLFGINETWKQRVERLQKEKREGPSKRELWKKRKRRLQRENIETRRAELEKKIREAKERLSKIREERRGRMPAPPPTPPALPTEWTPAGEKWESLPVEVWSEILRFLPKDHPARTAPISKDIRAGEMYRRKSFPHRFTLNYPKTFRAELENIKKAGFKKVIVNLNFPPTMWISNNDLEAISGTFRENLFGFETSNYCINITDEGLGFLNENIEILKIPYAEKITNQGIERFQKLRHLDVTDSPVNDKFIHSITPWLEELVITGCYKMEGRTFAEVEREIGGKTVFVKEARSSFENLTRLKKITAVRMPPHFKPNFFSKDLTTIILGGRSYRASGEPLGIPLGRIVIDMDLSEFNVLKDCGFRHCEFTDKTLRSMHKIEKLEYLELNSVKGKFGEIEFLPKVVVELKTDLDLTPTPIKFFKMLARKNIKILDIANTWTLDEDIQFIPDTVEELNVSDCSGLLRPDFGHLKNIRKLFLNNVNIYEDDLKFLLKNLPHTKHKIEVHFKTKGLMGANEDKIKLEFMKKQPNIVFPDLVRRSSFDEPD